MTYLPGISGLKALAALSVIYYHLNQLRPIKALSQEAWERYQFIETWTIAVSFFFMVSGMFLWNQHIQASEQGRKRENPLRQTFKRMERILPVFIFILILSIGIDIGIHGLEITSISKIL
jgi:peptidoglycan/LPS O-acetylase OafA/YrhL